MKVYKEYIEKSFDNTEDLFEYLNSDEESQELIRCEDCRYAKCIEQNDDWWECGHDKRVMHGDGFCSWAERKDNETD